MTDQHDEHADRGAPGFTGGPAEQGEPAEQEQAPPRPFDQHDSGRPPQQPPVGQPAGQSTVVAPPPVAPPPVVPPPVAPPPPAESAPPQADPPPAPVESPVAPVESVEAPPAPEHEPADDPFADWPEGESAEVIEDAPEGGASVEHVGGELDVPEGYSVLEGTPSGRRRSVAVVVSRFNGGLTNRMLAKAIETLEDAGVVPEGVTIVFVPGAFELPLTAMALAKTRRYACVVALGVIVRGETPHFDYIAAEAASGLQLAAIETGVPCAFGVLTVETVEQAEARIDRAADAVRTALEMADLFAQLRASAR